MLLDEGLSRLEALERRHRQLIGKVNSDVAEMMARLATDDHRHSELLSEFATRRGLL